MSKLAGAALVERSAGGRGGGGACLTARGRDLVQRYVHAEAEHARFVGRLNHRAGPVPPGPIALRTSARNQFAGTVCGVRPGSINDEIDLDIGAGRHIVATLTRASRIELGLACGTPAYALIKASAVRIAAGDAGSDPSGPNHLGGTVRRAAVGAIDTEVVLTLSDGAEVAAVIPNAEACSLDLRPGCAVAARFAASSVIVGVAV